MADIAQPYGIGPVAQADGDPGEPRLTYTTVIARFTVSPELARQLGAKRLPPKGAGE